MLHSKEAEWCSPAEMHDLVAVILLASSQMWLFILSVVVWSSESFCYIRAPILFVTSQTMLVAVVSSVEVLPSSSVETWLLKLIACSFFIPQVLPNVSHELSFTSVSDMSQFGV